MSNLKLFKTLLNKGLTPSYTVINAGGYDNGFYEEGANTVDGYSLHIEYGSGVAYNFVIVTLSHPKKGYLVIEERYQENCNDTIRIVPNREGHKVLKLLGHTVFDSVKRYWNTTGYWDEPYLYVPKWSKGGIK